MSNIGACGALGEGPQLNAQTETREAGDVQLSRPQLSAEDRLARVVEASPTALVLVGRAGRIEMVNRQAERMFGYDRADMQDHALEILLPERFRNGHVALRTHFLSDMSSRMMGEGRELFGLRRDGSEFPLEIGLTPIDFDGDRWCSPASSMSQAGTRPNRKRSSTGANWNARTRTSTNSRTLLRTI
jgi:PAS domain S-box-containing protein